MMNKEMVKFFRAFWIILFSNCSSCQNISFLNTIPAKFDLLHMNFGTKREKELKFLTSTFNRLYSKAEIFEVNMSETENFSKLSAVLIWGLEEKKYYQS